MSFGAVLDVVIGLVFIYLILAIIASGIQEMIAGLFKWRGTYLVRGIDVIMDNSSDASFGFNGFKDWIVAHFTQRTGTAQQPEAAQDAVLQKVLAVSQHPLLRGTPSALPSYVPARNFSLALLQCLRDGSNAPLIVQAESTIHALPEGDLKRILSAFALRANGDLDAFRAQVETWFDDAMDRLGGIYKRITQYVMLVIGLIIAVAFNIDTLNVARTLSTAQAGQAALVAMATQAASKHAMPAWDTEKAIGEFGKLPIPFGWTSPPWQGAANISGTTISGWVITALAISLGAPFWFDLLQNLSNLRQSGPKPNRADDPDEPGGSTPQVATKPLGSGDKLPGG